MSRLWASAVSHCVLVSVVLLAAGYSSRLCIWAESAATNPPALNFRARTLDYAGPELDEPDATNVTEVLLGWFGPSDPKHELGGAMWTAACLAIEEANRQGGFRGRPFRLVPHWSENPWSGGVGPLFRLVYEQRIWALLGSLDGPSAHLAEQVAVKARLPFVSPVSTDKSVNLAGVPWMYSCAPGDHLQAPLLVEAVLSSLSAPAVGRADTPVCRFGRLSSRSWEHRTGKSGEPAGWKACPTSRFKVPRRGEAVEAFHEPRERFVMFSATDHDSRAAAKDILRVFTERKRPPDFRFEFDPSASDIFSQLKALGQAHPRAIVIVADPIASARSVVALRRLNVDCAVFGTHHLGHSAFLARAGRAAEGVRFPLLFAFPGNNAEAGAFVKRFTARHGTRPDFTAVYAYDATQMLIDAVRRGGLNRARLREALAASSSWLGLSGLIQWDGTGQNLGGRLCMGLIRKGEITSSADENNSQ